MQENSPPDENVRLGSCPGEYTEVRWKYEEVLGVEEPLISAGLWNCNRLLVSILYAVG